MPQPLTQQPQDNKPASSDQGNSRLSTIFWSALGLMTLLRLAWALVLPLTGDEAYFWEWSRHPALCYYDHPPMAGWILWVTTRVLGNTVAAVRIVAVVAGTLVTAVVHRYTLEITGSRERAAWTGFLAMGIPVLAALGVLYSTDTPVLAAGTLGGYFFHRAVNRGDRRGWPLAGFCFAVLLASKFLGVPIIAASVLYLAARPDRRALLTKPGPWIAWSISLTGLVPVLVWNLRNGWATFLFNFGSRHASSGPQWGNVVDYLLGQSVGISPLLLLLGVPLLARAGFPWREGDGDRALAGFLALVPLGGFLVISVVTKVGVHWPAVGVPFLAVAVGASFTGDGKPGKLFLSALVLAWILTISLFTATMTARLLPADWEYPLRSDRINTGQLKKMVDAPEKVGARIEGFLTAFQGEGDTFVFTRSYALSSLAAFYMPGHPGVTVLGGGSVHGRNHLLWFNPEEHVGRNALYISYRPAAKEVPFVERFFDRAEIVSDSAGNGETPLTVIRCYGYGGTR